MKSVLVTGATGFIGHHLLSSLKNNKQLTVYAYSSKDGDVASKGFWQNLPKVDEVIHLGAKTFVPSSWEDPTAFINTNVIGTQNALEYCRQNGARLNLASAYIYGIPESLPISECHALKPNNPYALSKKLSEDLCSFYSDHFDVSTNVFRIFNVYGQGQNENFLIPTIVEQVRNKTEVNVKSLHPRRDYIHVRDVVSAIELALDSSREYRVLNLGSGVSYSVKEIIEMAISLSEKSLLIFSEENERKNDITETIADISRVKTILNWKPVVSFSSGLRELIYSKDEE